MARTFGCERSDTLSAVPTKCVPMPGNLGSRKKTHGPRYVAAIMNSQNGSAMSALLGTALTALGTAVLAAAVLGLMFVRRPVDAAALMAARFLSADDLIRRDMVLDFAFEAAFAWTAVFLAMVFWRCRTCAARRFSTSKGAGHGN